MMRVISGRRNAGKTTHLLKQLHTDPNTILLVSWRQSKDRILRQHPDLAARIFIYSDVLDQGAAHLRGLGFAGQPVVLIDDIDDFLHAILGASFAIGDVTTNAPVVTLP